MNSPVPPSPAGAPIGPSSPAALANDARVPHSRTGVVLFALLGYVYVLTVLAVLVVTMVVVARSGWGVSRLVNQFVGTLGFFVLGALWVRLLAPDGRTVTRSDCPALFAAIDEVRARLGAPAPDVVSITADLNAAVAAIPRFGIVGLSRRHLVIGLPLLAAMTPDEARAILAHEFAHLARGHNRLGNWVARVSITWQSLTVGLQRERRWGGILFLPFFRWYAPRLEALAQSLSRQQEHESDAMAAAVAGGAAAARALVRLHVSERHLMEMIWPAVHRVSADEPEPPPGAIPFMIAALRDGPTADAAGAWVRAAYRERTTAAASHPSLSDRIAALQVGAEGEADRVTAALLAPERTSAATAWLGDAFMETLAGALDAEWQARIAETWRQLHQDAQLWQHAASTSTDDDALSLEARWARARWAAHCEPPAVALPLAEAVLAHTPHHLEAQALVGRLLAQQEDASSVSRGIALLEQLAARDAGLALMACEALEDHYTRSGDADGVARVAARVEAVKVDVMHSFRERGHVKWRDDVEAYPLPAAMLTVLRERLAACPTVRRAYLVRKRTRHLRDQPFVVLALDHHVPWYRFGSGNALQQLLNELVTALPLPEDADRLVVPIADKRMLHRRLRRMAGACCYDRKQTDGATPRRRPDGDRRDGGADAADDAGSRASGAAA